MDKLYAFAGIEIALEIPSDRGYEDARMLAPFEVQEVSDPHRFSFFFRDALDAPQGILLKHLPALQVYRDGETIIRYVGQVQDTWIGAYARIEKHGRENVVQLRDTEKHGNLSPKTVLNCISAEHLTVQAGGVVFHSSFVSYQGKAILFTAPSGTGKSTQADLWAGHRGARIINGDRSVVRMTDSGAYACGIPFSGSSQICFNETLPLEAIVYLKQAPVTVIRRLRGAEAFRRVWEGCSINSWDQQDMERASEAVLRVLETVPVFELACTPDESAVLALEGALKG